MRIICAALLTLLPSHCFAKSIDLIFELSSINRTVETNDSGYQYNAETVEFDLLSTVIADQPISPSGLFGYPTADKIVGVSSIKYTLLAPSGMSFFLNAPHWGGGAGMNGAVTLVSNYGGGVLMQRYDSEASLSGFQSSSSSKTGTHDSDGNSARVQTLQPYASYWGYARWVNVFSHFSFSGGEYSFESLELLVNFPNPIDIAPLSIGIIAELYISSDDSSASGFVSGQPMFSVAPIPVPASVFALLSAMLALVSTKLKRESGIAP